jgi:hypothetical protein
MRISRGWQKCLLAGALFALVVPARAAEVDKYLPGDAEFVAQINIRQIIDSPLFKKFLLEKAKDKLKEHDDVAKIFDELGMDPFKDVSTVTTAGNGVETESKPYIIVHGNFDVAKFEAKAEKVAKEMGDTLKIHKEGDYKVYEVKVEGGDDKPMFVGIVDKTTIVASNDKDFALDCFARAAGKKKGTVKKELQDLLEKIDGKQSMWMAMPGSVLAKSPLSQDDKAKKMLDKMDSFTLGFTMDKDIKLAVAIASKSAENAKELAEDLKEKLTEAKGFLALIAGQMQQLAPLVDVVGNAKVETEGKTVTLKGGVDEELIEKALKP